jgi:hypothetical protein
MLATDYDTIINGYFKGKAEAAYGAAWGEDYAVFQYPNSFRAATVWYHDHTLGMTANNVYAGPAGFYIIRGGPGGDDAVIDSRTGTKAVLPGPAPNDGDKFPPNKTYYEIPIAIQDRAFNADGSLFYPNNRAFFEGLTPAQLQIPFTPDGAMNGQPSDVAPIWNPEFFANTIVVNGKTWPVLDVEPRRYRFRLLNGCDARFLILKIVAGDPIDEPFLCAIVERDERAARIGLDDERDIARKEHITDRHPGHRDSILRVLDPDRLLQSSLPSLQDLELFPYQYLK